MAKIWPTSIDVAGAGSALDPRSDEVSWVAFEATGFRAGAIASGAHLVEALRATADVLERTWDSGRAAAVTRVASFPDETGRASLRLARAVGVVGAAGRRAPKRTPRQASSRRPWRDSRPPS